MDDDGACKRIEYWNIPSTPTVSLLRHGRDFRILRRYDSYLRTREYSVQQY